MAEMENTTSATHDLRAMLDERGVEYETNDVQVSDTEWCYVTKLRDGHNDRWTYEELPGTDLLVSYQYDLGAEDAVAATLGPKGMSTTYRMMGTTYELKPCPFCGGKAEFRSGSSTTPYIRCRECGGRTKSSRNRANLIDAWNRRTEHG